MKEKAAKDIASLFKHIKQESQEDYRELQQQNLQDVAARWPILRDTVHQDKVHPDTQSPRTSAAKTPLFGSAEKLPPTKTDDALSFLAQSTPQPADDSLSGLFTRLRKPQAARQTQGSSTASLFKRLAKK